MWVININDFYYNFSYNFLGNLVYPRPTTDLWNPKREVWSQGPELIDYFDGLYKGEYDFCTTVLNGTTILVLGSPFETNDATFRKYDTVFLVNLPFNLWIKYPSLEILDYASGGIGVVMTFDKSGHR